MTSSFVLSEFSHQVYVLELSSRPDDYHLGVLLIFNYPITAGSARLDVIAGKGLTVSSTLSKIPSNLELHRLPSLPFP